MGAWGAAIMAFFGAVFAALTMRWQWHLAVAALALPFLVFVAIGLAAVRVTRMVGEGIKPTARAERVILWSSIGEGIGLWLAANIVINLGRPDLLLPAMALIVGLHFLPIALAEAFRPFAVLGTALILAAALGVIVAPPTGPTIAGLAAAASLWAAAILALHRDWCVRRSAPPRSR